MTSIELSITPSLALFTAALAACAAQADAPNAAQRGYLGLDSDDGAARCETLAPLAAGDTMVPIAYEGLRRSYIIHVPPGYTGRQPVPLVVNNHGLTQDASVHQRMSQLDVVSDQHGFVVVYPSSDSGSWNAGACCNPAGPDDVRFMRELVADARRRLCVDRHRIYATGMSNGGLMTHRLACEAADLFAAVAPVSGILPIPDSACRPSRPIGLLQVHGSNDELVDYDGGGLLSFIWLDPFTPLLSARDTVADWARRDGCVAGPSAPTPKEAWPDMPVSGGYIPGAGAPLFTDEQARMSVPRTPGASCEWYERCSGGVTVGLCTHDGGHDWASGTSSAIWRFFERHALP